MLSQLIEEAFQIHEAMHRGDPMLDKNLAKGNGKLAERIKMNRNALANGIKDLRRLRDESRLNAVSPLDSYMNTSIRADKLARMRSALGGYGGEFNNTISPNNIVYQDQNYLGSYSNEQLPKVKSSKYNTNVSNSQNLAKEFKLI